MKKKLNKKYLDEMPLDDYERELKEFIDKGEFVSDPNFEKRKPEIVAAAKRFLEKESKSITLRVKKQDLVKLKAKAAKNHIPYQTVINLLINSYNEGKTKLSL